MGKIRIFLDVSPHPFYESLILYPPKEVEYVNIQKDKFLLSYKELSVYSSFKRRLLKKIVLKLHYISSLPRIKIVKPVDINLYHSGRGVFIYGNIKYVLDLEYVTSPYGLNWFISKRKLSKLLLKKLFSANNLKWIIPHSYSALYSIRDFLGKDFFRKIKDKISVIYPAIDPKTNKPRSLDKSKITLLFVSSSKENFIYKGGLEVLHAFLELKNKYDIELIIRSDVPAVIYKKYKDIVKFIPKVDRCRLFQIYMNSDIFVYPTYFDTWGYVNLEAMSCALPIITSNTFAVPEIVRNYKNGIIINVDKWKWNKGYLVDEYKEKNRKIYWKVKYDVVQKLKEKIVELIEDTKLYRKLSRNNLLEVVKGRFSIKERNKKLLDVYSKCLE